MLSFIIGACGDSTPETTDALVAATVGDGTMQNGAPDGPMCWRTRNG